MAIGRPKAALVLSAEGRTQLSALAASRSLPHAMVAWAKMVLWAASGESNTAIAQRLGWSRAHGRQVARALIARRLVGLHDELRPGRPRSCRHGQVAGLISRVLHSRPKSATHRSVRSVAAETGISKSTVARYFALFGLQPHRAKSFKLSTDPFFVERVRTWRAFTSIPRTRHWCGAWMRRARFRLWSVLSRCCRWGWATSTA